MQEINPKPLRPLLHTYVFRTSSGASFRVRSASSSTRHPKVNSEPSAVFFSTNDPRGLTQQENGGRREICVSVSQIGTHVRMQVPLPGAASTSSVPPSHCA